MFRRIEGRICQTYLKKRDLEGMANLYPDVSSDGILDLKYILYEQADKIGRINPEPARLEKCDKHGYAV